MAEVVNIFWEVWDLVGISWFSDNLANMWAFQDIVRFSWFSKIFMIKCEFPNLVRTSWGWAVPSLREARARHWVSLPFTKEIEVIFYLPKNWGRLPFTLKFYLYLNIEVVFHFAKKNEVVFYSQTKLRSSSIYQKIKVVFQLLLAYFVNSHWDMLEKNFPGRGGVLGVGELLD